MNAKKLYRIEAFKPDTLVNEIVILAAISNGGQYLSLTDLQSVAKASYARYSLTDNTVSLIGNVLLVDKGTENLLRIEEVEVMELDMPELSSQEARDILDHESPTINRYGTGIADNTAHENLN